MLLRLGPHGDRYLPWSGGINLNKVKASPHGIDLGPARRGHAHRLKHKDGLIHLAAAPVVASMFTFEVRPSVPLPILIINGARDDEVPLEGGMSRNPVVRRAQRAPFKPLDEVVRFWVTSNNSRGNPMIETRGTVTTTNYEATQEGAVTEFVVDSEGGHGWPGSKPRREGVVPIGSFSAAERIWQFFHDKCRQPR